MAEWGYEDDWGASYDPGYYYAGGSPTFDESGGYSEPIGPGLGWDASSYPGGGMGSLSLEDQVRQAVAGRPDLYGSASQPQGWLSSVLGSLGSLGGTGGLAGLLGPALSAAGGIAGGAIGSNASDEAARLQADALNRGIDLSTSQWLQQLARTEPWVQAGQQALGSLQGLAGQQLPGLPGATPSIDPRAYGMPDATPRWTPQGYSGPQAPNAGDYRYQPGQIPGAANYRYTPGAVPTLQGAELLANDPGVQFRLDEGRKALEASALAKGSGMSGATLAALQRQGQELSSQEYSNAWTRAAEQARLREGWAQQASQMGWSQAEAESRLREQVNQIASQQGWQQALAGQQNQFTQGLDAQKWLQTQQQLASDQLYNRNMDQYKLIYGQDVARNETDYARQQALYKQQLAQQLLPWEQQSTLAQLGAQVAGQLGNQGIASSSGISNLLGQLGTANAMGTLGQAGQWNQAIGGTVGSLQNILRGLNA